MGHWRFPSARTIRYEPTRTDTASRKGGGVERTRDSLLATVHGFTSGLFVCFLAQGAIHCVGGSPFEFVAEVGVEGAGHRDRRMA